MKKFGRRVLAAGLCVTLGVSGLAMTGCKKEKEKAPDTSAANELDPNIEGDISIMLWAGDSKYYEDLGHKEFTKDDLTSQNVAATYAVAKAFNEKYPNVKINLWAKTGDPNQVNTPTWDQEIENFKTTYGKYADIWASTDVPGDIKKGIVADLSVFKEDKAYKSYNQTLMAYMNYYGFQAGLPSYSIPWGIWVNKTLAEENNIEVPDVEWTIDDYTDFATSGDGKTFWGSMNVPTSLINTGTKDINAKIANYDGSGEYVDVTTDAVQDVLEYLPEWAEDSINAQLGLGNVPVEIAEESGYYDWNYFCNNRLLTLDSCPWQMTAAADPNALGGIGVVSAADWDIYPRPSTDYAENTVGIVVDPICIHNYAEDDKDSAWSDEEKQKLLLTYTFATFWTASTEAREAISKTEYKQGPIYKSAMNDSFPLVTGDEYDKQMEIWYSIDAHKRYADADKMPGFQKVVEIFKDESKTWDFSDKCFPSTVSQDGETVRCMFEWENMWNGDIAGSYQTDPSWVNDVKSRLSDWNKNINDRFATAQTQLQDALKQYYGFEDKDFQK